VKNAEDARKLADFTKVFVDRLRWEVNRRKGFVVAREYDDLMDFQRDMTQASVEPRAVQRRAEVLANEFACWKATNGLCGDTAFAGRTGQSPGE
jgi:hypothetical protein